MVLNVIWVGFFLVAFAVGLFKLVVLGDVEVFSRMIESTFDMAKTSFEICLQLAGVLTLWLGIMKVGERAGAVALLAKLVRPFFRRLFPEVPADHPVHGAMILIAGALLLTPGFLTDIVGFLLLVPAVREALRGWFVRRMQARWIVVS